MVDNDYEQDFRVLYTFVPDDSFGQLLDTLSWQNSLETLQSQIENNELDIEMLMQQTQIKRHIMSLNYNIWKLRSIPNTLVMI